MQVWKDVSPSTKQPYVGQRTLERALFAIQQLQTLVPSLPFSLANPNGMFRETHMTTAAAQQQQQYQSLQPDKDLSELGLTTSAVDHECASEHCARDEHVPFYLVPVDETLRLNEVASTGLPLSEEQAAAQRRKMTSAAPDTLYGLVTRPIEGVVRPSAKVVRSVASDGSRQARRYTHVEPKRFCAEFWGVAELENKQRLYSETFFYAGVSLCTFSFTAC